MQTPLLHANASSTRTVTELLEPSAEEVSEYLGRDATTNLFMLSWLENYGICAPGRPNLFHFRGIREGDRLVGVALLITERLALLSTDDAHAARTLGHWHRDHGFRLEHVVSQRRAVTPFWSAYAMHPDIAARLVRDQELFVVNRDEWLGCREVPSAPFPGSIRLARPDDVHAIFWASARMHAEETLEDPLDRNPSHFRRHVEHRIDSGRTFAWFDSRRRLLFKADISAQSPWGAQISGVYTPKSLRGQGIATRAMYDLCTCLFERGFPQLTLYVNRTNEPARRVYRKVGFRYHTDYQTVFVKTSNGRR